MALGVAGVFATGCGDDNNAKMDAGTHDSTLIDAKPDQPPALTIAPLTSDFGSVTVGQTSQATTFTLTNSGSGMSDQVQVTLSGSQDYHLASNTCQSLAPAATCTVGVTFAPTATGTRTATLLVSVTGSSTSSMLTGVGGAVGAITASPSTFAFANAVVGTPGTDTDTITVTNTGGQATGALAVQATGSDATQFTKGTDGCSGMTLAAGASCTIAVKFTPTTGGSKSGSLTIIGAPGGTAVAAFSGSAATAPALAISPATQNFGSIVKGQTSSTVAINVANTGGSPTGTLTAAVSGTAASSFAIVTTTCNGVLAGFSTCQVTLRYTPAIIGAESATLTVSGTPGGSVTSALSGTGINAGSLSIDPTTFSYAATLVGATSATSTFTLTNGGGTAAGPVVLNLSGSDAGQFHIVGGSDNCSGTTLQPAGKCTVGFAFSPSSVGNKSATIVASANGNSVTSAISGLGTPAPQLALSPTTKDFGSNGIGTTTAATTFTLSNVGGAATTVPTITISGANANQFAQTNNCAAAIAPAGSCTISVTFSPTAAGLDSATLTASAATGGSVSANLFGSGSNPAQIAVLPGSLSFAQTTVGDQSQQTFTIQNNGSTTTGTIGIAITSATTVQFSQTSSCTTLAPGATCTVTVTFAPTATGNAAATATVTASPGGTATVALAGTAVPRFQIVSINGAPQTNPFDYGDVFVNATSDATFTLRNNTNQTQSASGDFDIGSDASYTVLTSNCSSNFLAHSTCQFVIRFKPNSVGVKVANITLTIGAGTINTVHQKLIGNGIPSIVVTPVTTSDFGNIVVGQTSPSLSFKVTNTASVTVGVPNITTLNAPFVASQGTCTGVLTSGSSCIATATFHPTTLGPETSSIVATSNPGGVATLDITGSGVSATDLTLSPAPVVFGNVFSGTTKDITVVVTNPAGAQTSGPIHYTLTGASQFTLLNNGTAGDCVDTVTALTNGMTCNLRLHFAPTTFADSGSTALTGQLTVTANPGATSGITANITGTSQSTISITPATYSFGIVPPGSTATKQFVVHNDSTAAVALSTTVFGGSASELSATANTCSGSVPANGNCTVTVTFAPTVNELDSATLTVNTTNGFGRAVATITAQSTDVLYDQINNGDGSGIISVVSSAGPTFDASSADDFTVPAGGWTLSSVDVTWIQQSSVPTAYTVTVYSQTGGLPGTVISTQGNITTFNYATPAGFSLVKIALPAPISLSAGTYWLSVRAQGTQAQQFWATRFPINGAYGAIQAGSGYSVCLNTFHSLPDCLGFQDDFQFRLHGTLGGTTPMHAPFVQPERFGDVRKNLPMTTRMSATLH